MPRMDKKMEVAHGYWRSIMNSIKASRAWRAAGYEFTKIKLREGIISLWSRQWKTGPLLCPASNLNQAWLSLPVYLEPSIHFMRPMVTMSEHRAGTAPPARSMPNPIPVTARLAQCAESARSACASARGYKAGS